MSGDTVLYDGVREVANRIGAHTHETPSSSAT
jgi:hypothetical protein